jgi:hypothetical protein
MIEGDLIRRHARVGALILTLLLGVFVAPAQAKTSGGLATEDTKTRFRDAVAFWDAPNQSLDIHLFPFSLSEAERADVTHPDRARALLAAHDEALHVGVSASFEGRPALATLQTFTVYHGPLEGAATNHPFVNGKQNPNWAGPKLDEHVQTLKVRLPSGERPGRVDLTTEYRDRWGTRWQVKVSKVPVLTPVRQDIAAPAPQAELEEQPVVTVTDGWQTSELGESCFYSQVQVDSQGRPHVALAGNHGLHYGVLSDAGWTWETVAGGADWMGGPILALALDTQDRPQLAYIHRGAVQHVARDGDAWRTTEAAPESAHASWVNLALDAEGHAALLIEGSGLTLATASRRTFERSAIAPEAEIGLASALALDAAGTPHVAYEHDGRALHAWPDGERWQTEDVCESSDEPVLTRDAEGRLHMLAPSWKQLVYVARGDGWSEPEVVVKGRVKEPTLAVGGDGSVHAAWLADSGKSLVHAQRTAEGWQVGRVGLGEVEGRINGWLSLAAGPEGKAHITLCWQYGSGFDAKLRLRHVGQTDATGGAAPSLPASAPRSETESEAESQPETEAKAETGSASRALATADPKDVARVEAEVTKRAKRWFSLRGERALQCRDCDGELEVRCKPCKGRQKVRCGECGGSGEIVRRYNGRRYRNTCYRCDGTGGVECKRCDEGRVDCDTCLPDQVPGFRALAGRRAFWDFISKAAREGHDRAEHFREVVAGSTGPDRPGGHRGQRGLDRRRGQPADHDLVSGRRALRPGHPGRSAHGALRLASAGRFARAQRSDWARAAGRPLPNRGGARARRRRRGLPRPRPRVG